MGSIDDRRIALSDLQSVVIVIGVLAAIGLWAFIYRTRFGVMLRATSQDRRMASALGINVGRVYVQAFAIGCFMAGLGGAVVVPAQAAVLGMGVDALILAFVVIVIGGLGSLEGALVGALIVSFVRTAGIQFFAGDRARRALSDRGSGPAHTPDRAVREGVSHADPPRAPALPFALLLAVARPDRRRACAPAEASSTSIRPSCSSTGCTFAIAALGFNLLLGYTGLLSFGHSAYFGMGAYTVAFIVRDLHVQSMELCILGGLLSSIADLGAVRLRLRAPHADFLRHPRRSRCRQVLWSLAFKFFWVTGGTDGIRVPRNTHHARRRPHRFHRLGRLSAIRLLLLLLRAGAVRDRGGGHVGDRAFALRQGAAGDPRQRDSRQLRRRAGAALSAGSPS